MQVLTKKKREKILDQGMTLLTTAFKESGAADDPDMAMMLTASFVLYIAKNWEGKERTALNAIHETATKGYLLEQAGKVKKTVDQHLN